MAKNCGNPLGDLHLLAKSLDWHPGNTISNCRNDVRRRAGRHCERAPFNLVFARCEAKVKCGCLHEQLPLGNRRVNYSNQCAG